MSERVEKVVTSVRLKRSTLAALRHVALQRAEAQGGRASLGAAVDLLVGRFLADAKPEATQ